MCKLTCVKLLGFTRRWLDFEPLLSFLPEGKKKKKEKLRGGDEGLGMWVYLLLEP